MIPAASFEHELEFSSRFGSQLKAYRLTRCTRNIQKATWTPIGLTGDPFEAPWRPLGGLLEPLGGLLEASWSLSEASWTPLGALLDALGASLGALGASLGALGSPGAHMRALDKRI